MKTVIILPIGPRNMSKQVDDDSDLRGTILLGMNNKKGVVLPTNTNKEQRCGFSQRC